MGKRSKSQPTVVRRADGSVYSQHRYMQLQEDRSGLLHRVPVPTDRAERVLADEDLREERRAKRRNVFNFLGKATVFAAVIGYSAFLYMMQASGL